MAGPDRDPNADLPKDGKTNALQSDIPSNDKGYHSLKPALGTERLIKDDGRIILVPTPSRDPADPLNWSPLRKWTILGLLVLWSATALSVQNFLSNFLPSVYTRFPDATTNQINLLLTISTPLVAPGQLVFVPLALTYGRRFSLLLSIILLMASTVWGACSTSYGSLLGARVVEGFAGGPTDAMGFTIIQEFSFVHERGRMLGVLMMGQLALQLVFAIATNYMAVSTGFKWPFVLFSCISAGTFIGLWVFMPETRYERRSGQNNEITLKEHAAIRKAHNSTGEFPHFGLKRQMRFWVGRGSGPDRDFFLIFRRIGTMLFHPVVWWSALLNAVITGYVLPFLICSSN
jgi:MFS family permease